MYRTRNNCICYNNNKIRNLLMLECGFSSILFVKKCKFMSYDVFAETSNEKPYKSNQPTTYFFTFQDNRK